MGADLGSMHSHSFNTDPKHLAFVLARYHFVARMLQGKNRVLEVGCGDGTGARLVKPVVGALYGIDLVEYLNQGSPVLTRFVWDITDKPFGSAWDAIYALDVLEHISPENEDRFFKNINMSLDEYGTVIIGAPSLESQVYASELSKKYHVNCMTEGNFRATLQKHYRNVYVLGMNDCTLHTGYGPMVHYRLAVCTSKK